MKLVLPLEINHIYQNSARKIFPVLLADDHDMVLIDCGYSGCVPIIRNAAKAKDVDIRKLTKILITHHDYDHMGALAEFKKAYPNLEVVSSEIEEKYISGKSRSLRLEQAEALYYSLPEDKRENAENFNKLLRSLVNVNVDITVKDHELMPWCGGTEIIATPGHMPGHISLYIKEFKTLIAGDAMVVENGKLGIANPTYTLDMNEAKRSIMKLLDYDIDKVICYHGGEFDGDVKSALREMLL